MIYKNCFENKNLAVFLNDLKKSKLSAMIIVKNANGLMKKMNIGQITCEDVLSHLGVKDSVISKLPLPLEALMYPKNDVTMKAAALTLLNQLMNKG